MASTYWLTGLCWKSSGSRFSLAHTAASPLRPVLSRRIQPSGLLDAASWYKCLRTRMAECEAPMTDTVVGPRGDSFCDSFVGDSAVSKSSGGSPFTLPGSGVSVARLAFASRERDGVPLTIFRKGDLPILSVDTTPVKPIINPKDGLYFALKQISNAGNTGRHCTGFS
ncbi:hypothetical protein KC333_g134 [Hortaea werneckii]|nr:hypothetical protein KC333_g134 [Hortaea werneckii]